VHRCVAPVNNVVNHHIVWINQHKTKLTILVDDMPLGISLMLQSEAITTLVYCDGQIGLFFCQSELEELGFLVLVLGSRTGKLLRGRHVDRCIIVMTEVVI